MPDDVLSRIQRKRISVPPRDLSLVPVTNDSQPQIQPTDLGVAFEDRPVSPIYVAQPATTVTPNLDAGSDEPNPYELDLAGVSLRLQRESYETLKQLCKGSVTINNSTLVEAAIDYLAKPEHKDLLNHILQDADQRGRVRSLAGERKKLQTRSIKLGL